LNLIKSKLLWNSFPKSHHRYSIPSASVGLPTKLIIIGLYFTICALLALVPSQRYYLKELSPGLGRRTAVGNLRFTLMVFQDIKSISSCDPSLSESFDYLEHSLSILLFLLVGVIGTLIFKIISNRSPSESFWVEEQSIRVHWVLQGRGYWTFDLRLSVTPISIRVCPFGLSGKQPSLFNRFSRWVSGH